MPVLDGIEATRQIVADERLDSVRVVILTNFGLNEYIFAALRAQLVVFAYQAGLVAPRASGQAQGR